MKKAVLFFGGGAMAGIFGAGVISKLQEANAYNKIKTVYGSSAGALNIAYFLAKQVKLGEKVYFEDLTKEFIHPAGILTGIVVRFWDRYIKRVPSRNIPNATNIDYLMKVIKEKRSLNIKAIKRNKVDGFVKIFDIEKQKIKYANLKTNTFQKLREAVTVIPYYFPPKRQKYVDGGIIEPVHFEELRKKHPNEKIVVCLNFPPANVGFWSELKRSLEGFVDSLMYRKFNIRGILKDWVKEFKRDVKMIRKDKNTLLVYPPKNNPTWQGTTDPKKLRVTFNMGRKKAQKVLKFIS